jgi:hypothetical protein
LISTLETKGIVLDAICLKSAEKEVGMSGIMDRVFAISVIVTMFSKSTYTFDSPQLNAPLLIVYDYEPHYIKLYFLLLPIGIGEENDPKHKTVSSSIAKVHVNILLYHKRKY